MTLSQYGSYRSQRDVPPMIELIRLWSAVGFVVTLLVLLAAISKTTGQVSRLWSVLWLFYALVLLSALRLLARRMLRRLRRLGYDAKCILLVGNGELAAKVITHLILSNESGYRLAGYLASAPASRLEFSGVPYLGTPQEAQQLLMREQLVADQVWVAMSDRQPGELEAALAAVTKLPHEIRVVPEGLLATLCELPLSKVAGLATIELTGSRMTGGGRLAKALEDTLLGMLALTAVLPLLVLIALLVRLDSPGPILFRQKRHGWNGQAFTVLKFRTMAQHQVKTGQYMQAKRNDPRVTRVGYWLRRTSLDELPQIFNVLNGSMSLVGPRPHPVEMNALYLDIIQNYMHRHRVKPGITGWAQVNGYRGETDTPDKMRRRVEYDLYYIENWSIGFDLVILVLTLVRGFASPQAY
jgi:putative colanic acid biosynthesis UDP-glucose lipid carrier transferase